MRIGYGTDVGRTRSINEDSLFVGRSLLVLADGMGGHQAGEVASRLAVRSLVESLTVESGEQSLVERVREAVRAANRLVYAQAMDNPQLKGMGTTLTTAVISDGEAVIGHVGDSRAYLVRSDSLVQLTEDHSVVWELMRSGGLSQQEAHVHPYRNLLTRALGTASEVEVDTHRLRLKSTDGLLLCSDGLSGVLTDDEILEAITAASDPQGAVDDLISMANARGGPDNVSVILALPEGEQRG